MSFDALRTFLNAILEPAAILDSAGRVLASNVRWSQVDADQALAGAPFDVGVDYLQRCAEVRHDADGEALARGVREILAGRSQAFTLPYACGAPTERRHAEVIASPLPTSDGIGALILHRDVTTQKETEAALRDTRERLERVLELLPEGYWDWNMVDDSVYYSDRWFTSLGYAVGEIAPNVNAWTQLLHPHELARVMGDLTAYVEGRSPSYVCETRVRRKDGTYRWNLDRARIVERDPSGKPTRMIGMEVDITSRKEAERVIQEQSRRLMDLSTPLIPISDEVVVMPLIGVVDPERAGQVLSTLLRGITETRARVAILDITGMSDIDAQVASVLVNAAKAVQLLGAQVVLTGVRPDVARTLVELDVDLGNILLRSTLQSGIASATDLTRGRKTR
ncbi:PAS domain-containing protein [Chondromyces apiculatus]|uniref:RsbR, positive regulator of sigma-B n=1 Tax=Chondromyces apiculatus DSM 436 TaxID=1192034 RepID=A0A017TH88_9BACT|nr:PAS domain-containing protein [Chondromyces apiculatus]EYF08292.1 RsbR, positive regulator of sigma-B [Chondromyces apiculatus DSM 436]